MTKPLMHNGKISPVQLIENQRASAQALPANLPCALRASGALARPPLSRARAACAPRTPGGPPARADHMPLRPTPYLIFGRWPQAEGRG
jgi:hypothetical protein